MIWLSMRQAIPKLRRRLPPCLPGPAVGRCPKCRVARPGGAAI